MLVLLPLGEFVADFRYLGLESVVPEGLKLHGRVSKLERVELKSHHDQLLCHSLCEGLTKTDTVTTEEGNEGVRVSLFAARSLEVL